MASEQSRILRRPPTRGLVALLAAILPVAAAWGGPSVAPGPISDEDLTAYAARLALSDDQRLAVDRFHEQYLEAYRQFRESNIDAVDASASMILRTLMTSPDSAAVRARVAEIRRLYSRIGAIDARLFDRMQGLLSEGQSPAMLRIRQARERSRYRSGLVIRYVIANNAAVRIDLSDLIDDADMTDGERAAIDPMLLSYEQRLTSAARSLHDASLDMFVDTARRLEDRGGQGRATYPALSEIWAETGRDVVKAASDISRLNLRTFRDLAPKLAEETRRKLRSDLLREGYPTLYAGERRVLDAFDAALALESLTDSQRGRLDAASRDFGQRIVHVTDRMVDVMEDIRAESPMFRFIQRNAVPTETQRRLERLDESRDLLVDRALATIRSILDAGQIAHVDWPDSKQETRDAYLERLARRARNQERPGSSRPSDDLGAAPTPRLDEDPYLPPPIDSDDLVWYARRLALGEEQITVLEALHMDYVEAIESVRDRTVQPLLQRKQTLWSLGPGSDEIEPPSREAIDEVFEMRRAALDEVRATDAAFFDSIELTIIDDDDAQRRSMLSRLRLGRDRIVFNRASESLDHGAATAGAAGTASFLAVGSGREAWIDLAVVLRTWRAPDELLSAIDATLAEYEREAASAFRSRYESALAYGRELDQANAALARAAREGRRIRSSVRDVMNTEGREFREAGRVISDLNRRTLERVLHELPAASAASLRRTYFRCAHADVYDDPESLHALHRDAMALSDLTERQRSRINELYAKYDLRYESLCEAMIELRLEAADSAQGAGNADVWRARQRLRDRLEQLLFERRELNAKAGRRLRAELRAEQLQRIGQAEPD